MAELETEDMGALQPQAASVPIRALVDIVAELRMSANGLFQLKNDRGDYGYFDDLADRLEAAITTDAMGMESQRNEGPLSGKSGALEAIQALIDEPLSGPTHDVWERSRRAALREALDAVRRATTQSAEQSVAEERGAFRTALEMIASGKFDPVETAKAALNDLDAGLLALAEQGASSPVEGEAQYRLHDAEDGLHLYTANANARIATFTRGVSTSERRAILAALSTRSVAVSSVVYQALVEARSALHHHYVEWDGEPEDALPLQYARAKCDAALSLLNQARKPEGERDYPAEFEAWWANYKHRNRLVAGYPIKKQIAFDAFYHAARSAHEAGEVERLRAALDHPLLREVHGFVEDAAPDEVMAVLRLWQDTARAALEDKS